MALTSLANYKAKNYTPEQQIHFSKNTFTVVTGKLSSLYTDNPFLGSAPTTAVVPTNTLLNGFVGQQNAGSAALRLGKATLGISLVNSCWILCDRLSHQGGLVANVNTAQTTNLPTAALTRYTDGVGVWAAVEIYTQIGTVATTVTASYTNQAGTSGQTSDAVVIGGTSFREVGRLILLPLAAGDYGVRAVASVTLAADTTTAGNIGVTLFKPLIAYPMPQAGQQFDFDPLTVLSCYMPEILDDACLFWVVVPSSSSTGTLQGSLNLFED